MSVNQHLDQAAGLRRLLASHSKQQICFLSELSSAHSRGFLLNFAWQLINKGFDVELFDLVEYANKPTGDSANKVYLIDVKLNPLSHSLINTLSDSDIVVITTADAEAIKSTYLKLKTLHKYLSNQVFKLLVIDTSSEQASLIQQNLIRTSRDFLGLNLVSLGWIPNEVDWQHSNQSLDTQSDTATAKAFSQVLETLLTTPSSTIHNSVLGSRYV